MSLNRSSKFWMIASVSTSWVARLSAAIFTFVTLPVILNALGSQNFAIYLYVINFPTWIILAMLGAQGVPAYLLSRLAKRSGSLTFFRARLGTALILPIVLVVGSAALATLLIWFGLIGPGSTIVEPHASRTMLLVSIWLTGLLIIGGVFENQALGLGRSYVFNVVRIAALALSLGGLAIAINATKRIEVFVLVTIGPQVFLTYLVGLYLMRQTQTMPIFSLRFRRHTVSRANRSLVSGFLLMSLPFVMNVQFGPTILGTIYGATDISTLLVLLRVLIFVAAFFGAITATSWPILGQLRTNGDFAALWRNALKLICGCIVIIVFGGIFTAFWGDKALIFWLPTLSLEQTGLMPAFAIYLSLYLWNTLWLAILCALGLISTAGRLSCFEAAIGLTAGIVLYRYDGSLGYLLGLIFGTLISTSLLAPWHALRSLMSLIGMNTVSSRVLGFGRNQR